MITDYLRFSANSIRELIRTKLNESSNFTDQNFQDSNLSVYLDTLSYMYSTMMYYLNHGASEAMFTDTQLYENMNRLTKLIAYNPRGFVTSSVLASIYVAGGALPVQGGRSFVGRIPKYTKYAIAGSTSSSSVSYSFGEDYTFETDSTGTVVDSLFTPRLFNGAWTYYSTPIISAGTPFETFTLTSMNLMGNNRSYIAHDLIDVYVRDPSGNITKFTRVDDLYNDSESSGNGNIFEARINEDYKYVLKFGDDIYGSKLPKGGVLYVIYFASDGPNGQIGAGSLNEQGIFVPNSVEGLDPSLVAELLKLTGVDYILPDFLTGSNNSLTNPNSARIWLSNTAGSTFVADFETVEEIRQNAPANFRIGGRLITERDFKSYILHNLSNHVYDVAVMNNWTYMVDFQQWLYQYGRLSPDLRFFTYYYADSCDFNNVYLWVVPNAFNIEESLTLTNTDITYNAVLDALKVAAVEAKKKITDTCDNIKCLTSELIPLDPLYVNISPYFKGTYSFTDWDVNKENKIQLIRDRNTMITAESIKQNAINIIYDFFRINNCRLGMTLDFNTLYNKLMAISGVKGVRTKYLSSTETNQNKSEFYDGLRFALWTNTLVLGDDFTVVSGNYKLRDFQFPLLFDFEKISERIEVAHDNYNITEVEY